MNGRKSEPVPLAITGSARNGKVNGSKTYYKTANMGSGMSLSAKKKEMPFGRSSYMMGGLGTTMPGIPEEGFNSSSAAFESNADSSPSKRPFAAPTIANL